MEENSFFKLIYNQPDLKNISGMILDTENRLKEIVIKLSQLKNDDFKILSMEFSERYIHLHDVYFPNVINNYCKLSIEYRNTVIIKNDNKGEYTSRDIFLQNIKKLIEETKILESQCNEMYSKQLLIQHRLISSLGIQQSVVKLPGDKKEISVELEDNFNYEAYKKTASHKIQSQAITTKEINHNVITKINNEPKKRESTKKKQDDWLGPIMFYTLVMSTCILAYHQVTVKRIEERDGTQLITSLNALHDNADKLFANEPSYKNISNALAIDSRIIPTKSNTSEIDIPEDWKIHIKSETITNPDDGLVVELKNIPMEACYLIKYKALTTHVLANKDNDCSLKDGNTLKLVYQKDILYEKTNNGVVQKTIK